MRQQNLVIHCSLTSPALTLAFAVIVVHLVLKKKPDPPRRVEPKGLLTEACRRWRQSLLANVEEPNQLVDDTSGKPLKAVSVANGKPQPFPQPSSAFSKWESRKPGWKGGHACRNLIP